MSEFKSPDTTTLVLPLIEGDRSDVLNKVPLGCLLRFIIPPNLHGSVIHLETNHPPSQTAKFERTKFWTITFNKSTWDDENYAEIPIILNGTFKYRFEANNGQSKIDGTGFFMVDPILKAGGQEISLNSLTIQTVLTKSLGPLKEWPERLKPTLDCNYNCIHFTPIQELGGSNSSYSIKNQLAVNPSIKATPEEIGKYLDNLKENGVLSFCDLVFNHTANETPWLVTNPETSYNLLNSPHLRPAYLLDAALANLSNQVGNDEWKNSGVPKEINKDEHLEALRTIILTHILPTLKLEQFYMLDTEAIVDGFKARVLKLSELQLTVSKEESSSLSIIQDPEYRRFGSLINWDLALNLFYVQKDDQNSLEKSLNLLRTTLLQLNESQVNTIKSHVHAAVENVLSAVRYERLDTSGPQLPVVDSSRPLIASYFHKVAGPSFTNLEDEETNVWADAGQFIMAHNGWVMGDDPLKNFAEASSNVYLRRELIAWSDSVKLRYGECPSSSPFLWNLMREYTEQTAKTFHGIRLDNCHSTPTHVAEYMLDCARSVQPSVYIFAELFTNSDRIDNIFVNRLGITSLIREALTAWSPHELGRLVFRYGGSPIGGFKKTGQDLIQSSIPHAILMDQTHDNPSPIEKRSLFDCLPTAALVAMASCATGSNRGFDELVPHHIHVVNETRVYSTVAGGIAQAKAYLNNLHSTIGSQFSQIFIDQHTPEIVVVTRHSETTLTNVILIAYTAFTYPPEDGHQYTHVKSLNIGMTDVTSILYQARLVGINGAPYKRPPKHTQDPTFINGLEDYHLKSVENLSPLDTTFVRIRKAHRDTILDFTDFQPGDIILIKTQAQSSTVQSVKNLEQLLCQETVTKLFSSVTLGDLNKILFRCEEEERDDTDGAVGGYVIPNFGPLVYCGLQGVISVLGKIRLNDDLGHPLCDNLRAGDWLMDYLSSRLVRQESTRSVGLFMSKAFQLVKDLPRSLIPRYFDIVITILYVGASKRVWELMSTFIQNGSPFTKQLALATCQVTGHSKSGYLPGKNGRHAVTLSAGLPHFSTGYMRNWGRDTFIALPGIFLVTGRIEDAKTTILAFASVLRHGLIPNLLDKGTHARYNCRDATWFWLYSIVRYCQSVPQGEAILKERVFRMYPNDDAQPLLADDDNSGAPAENLEDTIYESLSRHFQGIKFRERNAGQTIDAHMTDEGFNVEVKIDLNTGFPTGGNRFNCGTWMDKMGSSSKAGNKGLPATPRDGSPIEIVALAYTVMKFLDSAHKAGQFRHDSVSTNEEKTRWTWAQWHETIQANFESKFWIDENDTHELIHRRQIYKDTVGATLGYMDFQLRPNFVVAMGVADDLFTTSRALQALKTFKEILLGPLGVKTLDPVDWNYNGDYDNSNDSSDLNVAHGYNYHNGPEWLWPLGYYLQSYVKIHSRVGEQITALVHVKQVLSKHIEYINASPWRGLPELTNKAGSYCSGSCTTQAWSLATILETLHDVQMMLGGKN